MTGKSATKKAKTQKTTARKAGGSPTKAGSAAAAKELAKLGMSLKSDAKTPDQHADAAIVGLAQQHVEKDDHPTAGVLLGKLGTWAMDRAERLNLGEHMKVLGAHLLAQAMKRGF